VLSARTRLSPHRKDEFILHALDKIRPTNPKLMENIARWFVENQEYGRILAMVNEQDIRTNTFLLSSYLNALTFMGRNDDLLRLVNDKSILLSPATRTFFRAHLGFVTGKPPAELRPLFLASIAAAQGEGLHPMLLTIGRYGEAKGFLDIAEEAYSIATRFPRVERKAFEGLIHAASVNGHTQEVFRAAKEAARRWPDAQEFQEMFLYVSLLLGEDLELSLIRADRLLQSNDKDPMCKLLNALGSWRLGDKQSMAGYCQLLDIANLNDGQRSVLSGMVSASGYSDETTKLLGYIDPAAPMLPEERTFYSWAEEANAKK
jgi:hypothetical protein